MATAVADEHRKSHQSVRAEEAKHDVTESYDALRRDVADLATSVKRLADAEFGSAAANVQEATQRSVGQIETAIRKNPSQAALIAAGAGFLVGLMISR